MLRHGELQLLRPERTASEVGPRHLARAFATLFALLVAGTPAAASERPCALPPDAPAPLAPRADTTFEVRAGPGFFLVPGAAHVADVVCISQKAANDVLSALVEQVRRATAADPALAVVLTTVPLACGNLFYVPLANDVRGIGYQHLDAREVFDDSPESRLEGIAFLNDFPYWARNPGEFSRAFVHELAHRYGARLHVDTGDGRDTRLLGREEQHWSYFLDTSGSALEGNAWTTAEDGAFTADTPFEPVSLSDFDLYAMGVLDPSDATPERLLSPADASETAPADCLGHPLTVTSPPQSCGRRSFHGAIEPVSIDAVIAAEGERLPPPDPTPRSLDVAVIVLDTEPGLDPRTCASLEEAVRARVQGFALSTRGLLSLTNLSEGGAPCEALGLRESAPAAAAPASVEGGCAVTTRSASRDHALADAFSVACLLLLTQRGRRREPLGPR